MKKNKLIVDKITTKNYSKIVKYVNKTEKQRLKHKHSHLHMHSNKYTEEL